jgi:hypothetical protein
MNLEYAFILLLAFQLKHFVADYPLQNYQMVVEKGQYGKAGGIYHSLIHAVCTLVVLIAFNYIVFPIEYTVVFAVAALEFFIHYHIDWGKMQMSNNLSTKQKAFWNWIGFDQLLHHLTYLGFVWFIIGSKLVV